MNKALFLDRDGIILNMIFDQETGKIHTVNSTDELELNFGIVDVLLESKRKGYLNVIVSNQPNIGLGRTTLVMFEKIRGKLKTLLGEKGVSVDGEYYCFHHPFAVIDEYRKNCECRKPRTGMLLKAAKELDIDLSDSWVVGDGVNDVISGTKAGCKTVLVANIYEAEYMRLIEENLGDIKPSNIVKSVKEVGEIL
jgi:D-glycero-D-manno-heptose 1,7-bisphosphate phosphatase